MSTIETSPGRALGSGRPQGFARGRPGILVDPREYNFDPGAHPWTELGRPRETVRDSVYSRTIMATPGLVHYWTFDDPVLVAGNWQFDDAMGSNRLGQVAGTVTPVAGIVPGARGGAVKLNGANLRHTRDAIPQPGTQEIYSMEAWILLNTLVGNSALAGCWGNAATGYMVYFGGGGDAVTMFNDSTSLSTGAGTLVAGKLYHIVAACGGCDYNSQIYINGVNVLSSTLGQLCAATFNTDGLFFEVGSYADNAGGKMDGIVDELALYDRMLSAAEVRQHYDASFARL